MSNKINMNKVPKHLSKKQKHRVINKEVTEYSRKKKREFNRVLIKGINKSCMSLHQFWLKYNKNIPFTKEVTDLGEVLLATEFTVEDKNKFYKELDIIFKKYLEND